MAEEFFDPAQYVENDNFILNYSRRNEYDGGTTRGGLSSDELVIAFGGLLNRDLTYFVTAQQLYRMDGVEWLDTSSRRELATRELLQSNRVEHAYSLDYQLDYESRAETTIEPDIEIFNHYRPGYELLGRVWTNVTTDTPLQVEYRFDAEVDFTGSRTDGFGNQQDYGFSQNELDISVGFGVIGPDFEIVLQHGDYLNALRSQTGPNRRVEILESSDELLITGELSAGPQGLALNLILSPSVDDEVSFILATLETHQAEGEWMKIIEGVSEAEGSLSYRANRSLSIVAIPEPGQTAALIGLMSWLLLLRRHRPNGGWRSLGAH